VAKARGVATEPAHLVKAVNSDRVKVMYRVKRGDTLASVAHAFKTTVASLKMWNKLPGNRVSVGARLTVYQNKKPSFGG
jgi:LysM repeat protein